MVKAHGGFLWRGESLCGSVRGWCRRSLAVFALKVFFAMFWEMICEGSHKWCEIYDSGRITVVV